VSVNKVSRWFAVAIITAVTSVIFLPRLGWSQEDFARKVKSKVQPTYPDIAKRMNLTGTVKLEVVVAPNGTVKSTKVVGGHPLLSSAAVDALKKWRFEPGPEDTTGIIEFKFDGSQ
jgi:TonB family protein